MQDKTSSHAPIPTELNIAPRGKSWLHGELIDGEHGHPTRQSMETAERAAINQQLTTGKHLGTVNNSTPRSVDWHSHFVPEAGTKLYAAPVLEAPAAVAVPDAVTDEMVHAALRVQHPNMYRVHLRHPENGPASEARTEKEIDTARKMIAAALAVTPAGAQTHAEAAAAPATPAEPRESDLYVAAINCGHAITKQKVVLYFDPQKPGHNALNQLSRRLDAAFAASSTSSEAPISDAQLIALNAGERFFSESPSKYPEAGHSTQYHAGEPGVIAFARAALALRADPAAHEQTFQKRVQPWMMACFGAEISADVSERNHRFLEEAIELVQACGCTASEAHQLVDYVYGRPVGDKQQEVGGVMVTLAALCLAQGLDMHAAGDVELARIWTKVEAIRAKQAAKPKHSPLPISTPHLPSVQESVEKLPRYTYGYKGDDWGMNQSLRSYEAPDGAFLRRDEVLNAIAAITAKGNEA